MTDSCSRWPRISEERNADSPPPTIDRRAFLDGSLKRSAAAALSLTLLPLAAGCTAPARSFRTRSDADEIEIPLERFPELRQEGGAVKVVTPRRGTYFVRRGAGEAVAAFSAICTHQGCTVEATASGFSCPCHGSKYDRDGRNVAGPAPRPLPRFDAILKEDAVVLRLREKKP